MFYSMKVVLFYKKHVFHFLTYGPMVGMLRNMKNSVQTFSNASETFVSEGKNCPEQLWMGMPVEIALADIMKSLKSLKSTKSIDIHRYPPIPTRPLVMSSVQRGCEKKPET